MQTPARHPSPLGPPTCGADSHPTTAVAPPNTSLRHPHPSTIPRSSHSAMLLPHQNVRPRHGRVAAPRQVGVAPAPNTSYKGTLITTRGNMHGGRGDRSFPLISPARQRGGLHAARQTLFVSGGGLGRGVRPMAGPTMKEQYIRGKPNVPRPRLQESGPVLGVRQQICRPVKPPRPPGPPPPHILHEQKLRREMAALQRAQQSAVNLEGGSDRGTEAPRASAPPPGAGHHTQQHVTGRGCGDGSNFLLGRRDRTGDTHPIQAGESILGGDNSRTQESDCARPGPLSPARCPAAATNARDRSSLISGGVRATALTSANSGSLGVTSLGAAGGTATVESNTKTESVSDWQEFWDEEVEASYYYNSATREALWVRPDGV